jgi:hypothetical protein
MKFSEWLANVQRSIEPSKRRVGNDVLGGVPAAVSLLEPREVLTDGNTAEVNGSIGFISAGSSSPN